MSSHTSKPKQAWEEAGRKQVLLSMHSMWEFLCIEGPLFCNLLRLPIKILFLLVPHNYGYIIKKIKRIPKDMTLLRSLYEGSHYFGSIRGATHSWKPQCLKSFITRNSQNPEFQNWGLQVRCTPY